METLINQTLQVLRSSPFYDSIPDTNELEVFEGLEDAWEDFDITTVNGQQFIKENYATFRIRFDVVYNLTDCLPCLEAPLPPPPTEDYFLRFSRINQDSLRNLNANFFNIESGFELEAEVDFDMRVINEAPCVLFDRTYTSLPFTNDGLLVAISRTTNDLVISQRTTSSPWLIVSDYIGRFPGVNTIKVTYNQVGPNSYDLKVFVNGIEEGSTTIPEITNNNPNPAFFVNARPGVETLSNNFDLYSYRINDNEWPINEGQGYNIGSNTGETLFGQTANQGGITYWDEFVWQQITN